MAKVYKPKVIYAVTSGCYSDYRVLAVFTDKSTAERWAKALASESDSWVEEFDLVQRGIAPFRVTTWQQNAELYDDGRVDIGELRSSDEWAINTLYGIPPIRPQVRYVRALCHDNRGGRLEVRGAVRRAVLKVVSERIAMWKAGTWAGPKHDELIEGGDDA